MQDRYLIVEMAKVVSAINEEYPLDSNLDYKPLLKIAEFIYKQMQMKNGPENNAYAIIPVWEQLYTVIYKDPFYGQKSLTSISNHIQEFWQKTAYGDRKNAKLNPDKLRKKIAAKYFESKQNPSSDASKPL